MERKPYPSDLTNEEWAIIKPLMPKAKPRGRRRTVNDLYENVDLESI
jgi:transposase